MGDCILGPERIPILLLPCQAAKSARLTRAEESPIFLLARSFICAPVPPSKGISVPMTVKCQWVLSAETKNQDSLSSLYLGQSHEPSLLLSFWPHEFYQGWISFSRGLSSTKSNPSLVIKVCLLGNQRHRFKIPQGKVGLKLRCPVS